MDAIQMSQGKSAARLHEIACQWLSVHFIEQKDCAILDYGSGQGLLSKRLHGCIPGAQITAIDAMREPHWTQDAPWISWVQQDLNDPSGAALSANKFDALLAIEVIEHLENPRAQARQWFDLLKPGGRLLFSTPNVESIRSLLSLFFRGHFVDFTDSNYPAHITPLIAQDAIRILDEAGFQKIQLTYSDYGTVPVFTSLSWQQCSAGLLRGKRFSDQIFVSATKPVCF